MDAIYGSVHTSSVSDFPQFVHVVTYCDDDAGTFVTSNAFGVVVHGDAEVSPFVVDEGLVGGAEAGPERMLGEYRGAGAGSLPVDLDED